MGLPDRSNAERTVVLISDFWIDLIRCVSGVDGGWWGLMVEGKDILVVVLRREKGVRREAEAVNLRDG